MLSVLPLDICGRRRSPATPSGFYQGRLPRNKGLRYPADPPTVEEIIGVMRAAGDDAEAVRLRGLIVVLWRAGLRISEALALSESDLDPSRGAILVRHGLCRIRHNSSYVRSFGTCERRERRPFRGCGLARYVRLCRCERRDRRLVRPAVGLLLGASWMTLRLVGCDGWGSWPGGCGCRQAVWSRGRWSGSMVGRLSCLTSSWGG